MGPMVTTNSATLVNKGLELIEAHLLFGIPFDRIDVVVHPQSIVHSMVEFVDGSILAQASPPDMRLPIALGLAWPDRVPGAVPACDFSTSQNWQFEPLDRDVFASVDLAVLCGTLGGTYPAVYNAANEECVAAFLEGRIGFLDIVDTIDDVVRELRSPRGSLQTGTQDVTVSDVLAADAWGRERARARIRPAEAAGDSGAMREDGTA
jgi:1-deoxy-D-xylulose-5-phosphate reductoisomerase